jgi:hypothetical protein
VYREALENFKGLMYVKQQSFESTVQKMESAVNKEIAAVQASMAPGSKVSNNDLRIKLFDKFRGMTETVEYGTGASFEAKYSDIIDAAVTGGKDRKGVYDVARNVSTEVASMSKLLGYADSKLTGKPVAVEESVTMPETSFDEPTMPTELGSPMIPGQGVSTGSTPSSKSVLETIKSSPVNVTIPITFKSADNKETFTGSVTRTEDGRYLLNNGKGVTVKYTSGAFEELSNNPARELSIVQTATTPNAAPSLSIPVEGSYGDKDFQEANKKSMETEDPKILAQWVYDNLEVGDKIVLSGTGNYYEVVGVRANKGSKNKTIDQIRACILLN